MIFTIHVDLKTIFLKKDLMHFVKRLFIKLWVFYLFCLKVFKAVKESSNRVGDMFVRNFVFKLRL